MMVEQDMTNGNEWPAEIPENLADVGLHVKGVVEEAEREAAEMIERARAEGGRGVGAAKQRAQELVDERQARINEIRDDLLRQAEAIEGKLSKLDDALGTAIEDLVRELEQVPEPPRGDVGADDAGFGRTNRGRAAKLHQRLEAQSADRA